MNVNRRARVAATAVLAMTVLALTIAACGPRKPHPSRTTTVPPVSPTSQPGPTSSPTVATTRQVLDCGVVYRGGAPTTMYNGQTVSCFIAAWNAGTPARAAISGTERQELEVVGVHRLVLRTASGPPLLCTGLSGSGYGLAPSDCEPLPSAG
jgi:hypothetical protein